MRDDLQDRAGCGRLRLWLGLLLLIIKFKKNLMNYEAILSC